MSAVVAVFRTAAASDPPRPFTESRYVMALSEAMRRVSRDELLKQATRQDAARWLAKVDRSGGRNACWPWLAAIDSTTGYGVFSLRGRTVYAHRFSYSYLVGPIPDGRVIDHTCHDERCRDEQCAHRACVNPYHLEPVAFDENMRRSNSAAGVNARKTHCKRGHEFTPANTHYSRAGQRICRECRNERARKYRAERSDAYATDLARRSVPPHGSGRLVGSRTAHRRRERVSKALRRSMDVPQRRQSAVLRAVS